MSLTVRRCLIVWCALLAAAGAASGQEGGAAEKRAAIRKLLEVGQPARQGQLIFEKVLDRFREPITASLIAGLRADGHFKALSAADGAELERRIRVYMDDVFEECKARMSREVATPENMERVTTPAYDKHLTLEDVNRLIAFEQSQLGRRLKALLPEAVAEGAVASLEAKGVFEAPSLEEMAARVGRAQKELQADPARRIQEILTAAAFAKRLTPDEVKELDALRQTPFWVRFVEVYPRLQGEIQANFSALYGGRAGSMLGEVYSRKLEDYAVWLSEATRPGAPRGVPPPVSGRLPTPVIVAPPRRP